MRKYDYLFYLSCFLFWESKDYYFGITQSKNASIFLATLAGVFLLAFVIAKATWTKKSGDASDDVGVCKHQMQTKGQFTE